MSPHHEPLGVDANGALTERISIGDSEIIVHHVDDIPDSDLTVVKGIPCTTPLRTLIDVAPDTPPDEFKRFVRNALGRDLFTIEEARRRVYQPDMANHPGAMILWRALAPYAY